MVGISQDESALTVDIINGHGIDLFFRHECTINKMCLAGTEFHEGLSGLGSDAQHV